MLKNARSTYRLKKSKAELAIQDVALTLAAYALFFGMARQWVPTWLFCAFILVYTFRSFNLRHEKAHTAPSTGFKMGWLDSLSDYVQIFYLPYHEPYTGKRWKHLAHHRFHTSPELHSSGTIVTDPHRIFESGSIARAMMMSFLYDEVNLYLDLKHRGLSRERLIVGLFSLPVIATLICFGGWTAFLVLAVCYRVSLMLAWFTFSYVMHLPNVYNRRIGDYLPMGVLRAFDFVLGHGLVTAVFYHSSHHARPNEYVELATI